MEGWRLIKLDRSPRHSTSGKSRRPAMKTKLSWRRSTRLVDHSVDVCYRLHKPDNVSVTDFESRLWCVIKIMLRCTITMWVSSLLRKVAENDKKIPSADRVTLANRNHNNNPWRWQWLTSVTFNLGRAKVTTHKQPNNQGQRSVGSKDRVETNARTDGHNRLQHLPCYAVAYSDVALS